MISLSFPQGIRMKDEGGRMKFSSFILLNSSYSQRGLRPKVPNYRAAAGDVVFSTAM